MVWLVTLFSTAHWVFRSRPSLQIENLALRHQLAVLRRTRRRPRIRPALPREIRDLIRKMSAANPLWGAPHIVGELRMIGIDFPKSTVAEYMVRRRKPPSATWRAFLKSHLHETAAVDFFVVPTVRNQVLIVFLVLAHDRRRVLHFNVTANLTAEWTAQQIVEAFPLDDAPRFLLRDRDGICGEHFCRRERNMGIEEVVIAPVRHGRIHSSSALSARSAASVSIT